MDNQNQTTEIVLAIDPGSAKFGYAIVDSKGEMLSKGVGKHEDFETIIATLIDANHITAIALGDGTNSAIYLSKLSLYEVPVIMIDESHSTEEARKVYFDQHPPKGLERLVPASLRTPNRAIDDCAAVVLAHRYWKFNQFAHERQFKTTKVV